MYGPFNTGSSAPAETGMYNAFVEDEATGQMYALVMVGGLLCAMPVEVETEPTETTYIDVATGTGYVIGVENNLIYIQEV